MYHLYQISDSVYQLHSTYDDGEAKEGSLLAILTYGVHKLGFNTEELEDALLEMLDSGNDAAKFDYNKNFLYSYQRFVKKTG